ncbi:MAG: adenylate/guanylate cyclase domain-containing protein [Verrucomicrobiota bacterium]
MPDQENRKTSRFRAFWQTPNGKKAKGALWGMLLSGGIGVILNNTAIGDGFVNKSYDLPFIFKPVVTQTNVLMVYLDDDSHDKLNQKYLEPWNRAYYTQLVKRATAEKAKAVIFDVVFSDALNTNTDADFAQAMQENGNVIVAVDEVASGVGLQGKVRLEFTKINDVINAGAADRGNTALYAGADDAVRWYVPIDKVKDQNGQEIASEALAAMVLLDQSVNEKYKNEKYEGHWINYYGPELSGLQSVSLYKALKTNDPAAPPGLFKGKVIFVGEKLETKPGDTRKDEYPSPFSYLPGNKFFTGVGIHATAFLNFLQDEWLRRLPAGKERIVIIFFGVIMGAGLMYFRPVPASVVALCATIPIAGGNYYLFIHHHFWFPWLIPVAAQIPVALGWSVAFNSIQLYVDKQKVEQSLSLYLPARLVKKFASDPTLLKPGAKKQQLTILFSDIAGFTTITEGMDPDQLAKLMNAYFQSAVDDCIHFTEGTIVKYIGDAIFAFWNAPDPQDDHPYRAAEAALRFRDQDKHEFNGKKVLTRIGLHTGEANVGNFGSTTRVDYTAFGENINLSSRMEGLNKYLGTRVLMTGDTYEGIGLRMVTRYLGLFRLKGFAKAVNVYELMDRPENGEKTYDLRKRFEEALNLFRKKDFAGAEAAFRRVLDLNPQDGPSHFYLEHIGDHRAEELPPDWKGEITLKEK